LRHALPVLWCGHVVSSSFSNESWFAHEAQEKKVVKLTFSLFMGLEEGCYVHSEKAEDGSSFLF